MAGFHKTCVWGNGSYDGEAEERSGRAEVYIEVLGTQQFNPQNWKEREKKKKRKIQKVSDENRETPAEGHSVILYGVISVHHARCPLGPPELIPRPSGTRADDFSPRP